MMVRLGLIDYGMGNLHSVEKAFLRLGKNITFVNSPKDLASCDAVVLPGVGAFDPAIRNLGERGLITPIRNWAIEGKPLLGICLGLQLFFESSAEGSSEGLGLFEGQVELLPSDQGERIPHMGWSLLKRQRACPLFEKHDDSLWMYFVHSYAANPTLKKDIAASCSFGKADVTAVIWKGRIGACQFHPEKSAVAGQRLLKNWLFWLESGAEVIP